MKKNIIKVGAITIVILLLLGLNLQVSFDNTNMLSKEPVFEIGHIAHANVSMSMWCFESYSHNILGDAAVRCTSCSVDLGMLWTGLGKCDY